MVRNLRQTSSSISYQSLDQRKLHCRPRVDFRPDAGEHPEIGCVLFVREAA
jgi:hypothetical protein